LGGQTEKNEMDRTCGTHGGQSCIKCFGGEAR